MSKLVVDMLLKKRQELFDELKTHQYRIGEEIEEINVALMNVTGKKWEEVKNLEIKSIYDDENPDSIKGTEDGI